MINKNGMNCNKLRNFVCVMMVFSVSIRCWRSLKKTETDDRII